jgi:quercetin dioxygenase-like cupin family protein
VASDAEAEPEAEEAAPSAFEAWNDYDPSMRFIMAYPLSAAQGTESGTIAYFACEPGQHSGLHADSAEELVYVMDGEGEVFVSGVQKRLEAGNFLHIPTGVQHDVYAYGDVTLRLLSFFPSARVESTFTEILLPFGDHTLASDIPLPQAMPQLEEISFDDLPPELQDMAGAGWTTFEGADVAGEGGEAAPAEEAEGEEKPAES